MCETSLKTSQNFIQKSIKINRKMKNLCKKNKKNLNFCVEKLKQLLKLIENSSAPELTLISTEYDLNGQHITFKLKNKHLLDNKQMLKAIFYYLMTNDKFINFGETKIIIVKADHNKILSYMLHHNIFILLDNNTTFKEYYDLVKDNINNLYSNVAYKIDTIPQFDIIV
jgi:hypothetical protein